MASAASSEGCAMLSIKRTGISGLEKQIAVCYVCLGIGLASFLFRANVPDFQSPLCSCGFGEETAQHITFFCNKFLTQRQQATFFSYNFSFLLQKPKVLKEFLLWFMSLKRLDQFNLAHKLLSESLLSL